MLSESDEDALAVQIYISMFSLSYQSLIFRDKWNIVDFTDDFVHVEDGDAVKLPREVDQECNSIFLFDF